MSTIHYRFNEYDRDDAGKYLQAKKEISKFLQFCIDKGNVFINESSHSSQKNTIIIKVKDLGDTFYLPQSYCYVKNYNTITINCNEYENVVIGCLLILKKHMGKSIRIACSEVLYSSKITNFDNGIKLIMKYDGNFIICPNCSCVIKTTKFSIKTRNEYRKAFIPLRDMFYKTMYY